MSVSFHRLSIFYHFYFLSAGFSYDMQRPRAWLQGLPSPNRRDLILLQLSIRRLERPHPDRPSRERHPVRPVRPPAAQRRSRLHESRRRAERTEAGLKILERLIVEVEVRVRREERAVDRPVLQSRKDRFRLRRPAVRQLVFAGE